MPAAKAFFFAPFVSSVMHIDPAWIDYNGHLNMAYYNLLFDRAFDEVLLQLGIGEDYRAGRNGTVFVAETHVQFRREIGVDTPVRATVHLVDFDDKRLHYYSELRHAHEGWLSASSESLSLHIDLHERKVSPFPPDILDTIATMRASHAGLPRPEALGRIIGLPVRARPGRPGVH
jgi:acyl-CoA thioester hydrolase